MPVPDPIPRSVLGYPDELVGPGQTHGTAWSAKIGDIVLRGQASARRGWFGFRGRSLRVADGFPHGRSVGCLYRGRRDLGHQRPGGVGVSPSSTLSGGSASGTRARSSRRSCLLVFQKWRNSINRFTEAMTLFAVACAGSISAASPGTPVGLLLDRCLTQTRWVSGRSGDQPARLGPLRGLAHILSVSLAILVRRPDSRIWRRLARPRRASVGNRIVYRNRCAGLARVSAVHWQTLQNDLYLLLAGLAAPLVLSVHSVV